MEFSGKTIDEFIGKPTDITINIPCYQRNYRWEEKQCEQLMRDIKEATQTDHEYYMGHVYVKQYKDYYDLIDGQQRMTTLTLLMIAILNTVEEIEKKNIKTIIPYTKAELKEIKDKANSFIRNKNKKLKIQMHKSNMETFLALATTTYEKAFNSFTKTQKESTIHKNYKTLKNAVTEWAQSTKNLDSLVNITKKMVIGFIVINDENAQQIFERINATGTKLTDTELIKSSLFQHFEKEKATRIYNEYWEKIEENVTEDNMEDFISSLLPVLSGENLVKGITRKGKYLTLYEAFKYYYNRHNPGNYSDEVKDEKILQSLLYYSFLYKEIMPDETFNISKAEQYRKKIYELTEISQCSSCNSLLLYLLNLLKQDEITEKEFCDTLWPVIIYNIRAKTANKQQVTNISQAHKLTVKLIRLRMQNNKADLAKFIWQYLTQENETIENMQMLSNKDFKHALANYNIAEWLGQNVTIKYLLYLVNKAQKKGQMQPFLPTTMGVYKIMPTTESDKWKEYLEITEWKNTKEYSNRLGNCVLDYHQSGINGKTFDEKRPYLDKSKFPATKAISNIPIWNFHVINKLSQYMAEIIGNYYKGPEEYENNIKNFLATD